MHSQHVSNNQLWKSKQPSRRAEESRVWCVLQDGNAFVAGRAVCIVGAWEQTVYAECGGGQDSILSMLHAVAATQEDSLLQWPAPVGCCYQAVDQDHPRPACMAPAAGVHSDRAVAPLWQCRGHGGTALLEGALVLHIGINLITQSLLLTFLWAE